MGLATFEIMKWQVPGLATFEFKKWQVQWDLPLLNGVETGWIRKFLGVASPLGLATFELMKWQVPGLATFEFKKWQSRDLPLLNSRNGKSHGTCHFRSYEVASPLGLATFEFSKWQVPRDLPL